jgi:hypothetical protein
MTEKKIRRSPEELAAHHKALARKHELRAKYAGDSTLAYIAKTIDILNEIEETDERFDGIAQLREAIDALGVTHDKLIAN